MDRRPPGPAPDLFTALQIEPATATPPIGRDHEPAAALAPALHGPVAAPTPTPTPTPAPAVAPPHDPTPAPVGSAAPLPTPRVRTRTPMASATPAVPVSPAARTSPARPSPARTSPARTSPARTSPAPRGRSRTPASLPAPRGRPEPSRSTPGGLADLLEPTGPQSRPPAAPRAPTGIQGIVAQLAGVPRDPGRAAAPIVDLDEQLTAPFPSMSSGPVPQYGPDIDPDPDLDALPPALAPVVSDPEPWEAAASARGRGGMVWGFVALSVMLAAALGWVLYTQTDIFEGDVVAKRDAQAQAEAEAELARAQQAAQDDAQQLGTIQLSSEPDGARVWLLRDGPTAKFDNLPIDGEYMIAVTAPGHVPRVRLVKGSELSAPVIMDLDPLDDASAPAPELPDAPVPKVGKDTKQTATLELRSNTPDADLALLVGYTPGVTIVDIDVRATHRLLVTLAGHEPAAIEVKGRFFEEQGDALVYDEVVDLNPRTDAPPAADGEDEIAIDDDE